LQSIVYLPCHSFGGGGRVASYSAVSSAATSDCVTMSTLSISNTLMLSQSAIAF
jgi:hypothetical protein